MADQAGGLLRTWGWSSTFLMRGQWIRWILSTKVMGQLNECGIHVQERIISSFVTMSQISTKLHCLRPPIFIISQVCKSRNFAKIWLVSLLKNLLQVTVKMVHKAGILSEGLTKEGYACFQPLMWLLMGFSSLRVARLSFSSELDVDQGFLPTSSHGDLSMWLIASSKHAI